MQIIPTSSSLLICHESSFLEKWRSCYTEVMCPGFGFKCTSCVMVSVLFCSPFFSFSCVMLCFTLPVFVLCSPTCFTCVLFTSYLSLCAPVFCCEFDVFWCFVITCSHVLDFGLCPDTWFGPLPASTPTNQWSASPCLECCVCIWVLYSSFPTTQMSLMSTTF